MDAITSSVTFDKTENEQLSYLTHYALRNNFSLAVWRSPNDHQKHLILSRQHQWIKRDSLLEDLPSGFVFSPFDRDRESLFLPADFSFSFVDGNLSADQTALEISSHALYQEEIKKNPQGYKAKPYTVPLNIIDKTKAEFLSIIENSLHAIDKGTYEKIVPSRTKTITLDPAFDIITSFNQLCSAYPNALVSFVSSPECGSWMGATPELLVSVEDKTIFRTVALAGTKPHEEGVNLRAVAWTQKEIEEQALVERYIISCFKKIRLREYEEHGPKTVVAGNLMHLKSDFTVDMKETNFPLLGSVMLQLLHPTSAVCGMPLDASLEFLNEHEGYNRGFYSGFLGPVNFKNSINIYVNLRCMQLFDKKAILYAGAGVTMDSIPEQEWEETEMKFNTLLKILRVPGS